MNRIPAIFAALVGLGMLACSSDEEVYAVPGVSTAKCGDKLLQPPEECDDGNSVDDDGCSSCRLPRCGDGVKQTNEECDDGNSVDADDCTSKCRRPACGDGVVQAGEECDDGNTSSHDACTGACKLARCGDGIVRVGLEGCDDGNADETDGCSSRCTLPNCGDGVVQAGEQCDDGNSNDTDACLATCQSAICGDGRVYAALEQCDDGNADSNDSCRNDCKLAFCGDGIVQVGVEGCDDGNANEGDGCTGQCRLPHCGDGVLQAPEQCDDGNASDSDACLTTCQVARCGDGRVHTEVEQCDDGNADSNDNCRNDCKLAVCGDGILQTGVEGCDDGNLVDTDGCTSLCRLTSCGDGVIQAPEECDDGNSHNGDACLDTCQKAFCGDRVVRDGSESCDDGNRDDNDGCTNACTLSSCGDGIVQAGEECDDGNASNEDTCLLTCRKARCGDGYVQLGIESCDDGNLSESDACLPICERARCGDGVVWVGSEACDDGNMSDNDGCRTDCSLPTCGDGKLQPGEQCDDGNFDNTDGCLLVCIAHDYCDGFAITAVTPPMACLTESPTSLELTASGSGFLVVNGTLPTVRFAGNSTTIISRSNCVPLYGLMESIESCARLTISVPASLATGTHAIEVENPVTQYCPASSSFSMASAPTVTDVAPRVICEYNAPNLTLTGAAFVPSTLVSVSGPVPALATTFVDSTELIAHFDPLSPGSYSVTVSNGEACSSTIANVLTVVPQPRVFFVEPPVMYNGINIQGTIYVSGINGGNVTDVRIRQSGTELAYRSLSFTYDPTYPKRIQATFPKGLAMGNWDVQVVDSASCAADLPAAFRIVDNTALNLAMERIAPAFGHTSTRTGVTLYATNPVPTGKTGFQAVPLIYLNPTSPTVSTLAARMSAVGYVAPDRVNAVVPSGLNAGAYDVIVVNPDGTVGLLAAGFTVTTAPPPVVDAISPVSLPNNVAGTVTIYGSGFNNPTVRLECQGIATPYAVTVNSSTSTQITTTVPANQLANGSVCVVRVTNPDASYDEYSALGITNLAELLLDPTYDPSMSVARRAPAVTVGQASESSAFLYVLGGDNGTSGGALDSIEAASLDRYGKLGSWRTLPRVLPSRRTLARAEIINRHIFLVGGNDGSSIVSNVWRSEILDPNDAPIITDIGLELSASGLGAGLWTYRVSAVLGATHADNPLGETLPSDPQVVRVPAALPQPLKVTVSWSAVAGASSYRVYRSPTAGSVLGQEELIGIVTAPTTNFVDEGDLTDPAQLPLQLGDLGVWVAMPGLRQPREGFGLAKAQDPNSPDSWYLYAVAGRTTGNTVLRTYEYLPLSAATGLPAAGSNWTEHTANPLVGPGRWQLGAIGVDKLATTRFEPNATWIYAGSGVDATASSVAPEFDAALVQTGGQLANWMAVDPLSSLFAGYGHAAVANQIWIFGGQNATADDRCRATQLCGIGNPCTGGGTNPPDPPDLENWDAGFQFNTPRYLLGSVAARGRIFLIGGLTTGSTVTATVESTVW